PPEGGLRLGQGDQRPSLEAGKEPQRWSLRCRWRGRWHGGRRDDFLLIDRDGLGYQVIPYDCGRGGSRGCGGRRRGSTLLLLHEGLRRLDALAEVAFGDPRHSRGDLRSELRVIVGAVDELVPADLDLVTVAQEVLGDRLVVDQRAVG